MFLDPKKDAGIRYTFVDLEGPRISCVSLPELESLSIDNILYANDDEPAIKLSELHNKELEALKSYISSLFRKNAGQLDTLEAPLKADFFNTLARDLFRNYDRYPGLQGFYFDLCLTSLRFQGSPSEEVIMAARSVANSSPYTREWDESSMSLCLGPEYLQSAAWSEKRLDYLTELMHSSDHLPHIKEYLKSGNFAGVTAYLKSHPAKFLSLAESYCDCLLDCMQNSDFMVDAGAIYANLINFDKLGFLEDEAFLAARNQCLDEKIRNGFLHDLPAFLSLYARESMHPLSFAANDWSFFSSFEESSIAALSRYAKHADHSVMPALQVLSQLIFSNRSGPLAGDQLKLLIRAVRQGTEAMLEDESQGIHVAPDAFIALLPSKLIFHIDWGRDLDFLVKDRLTKVLDAYHSLCSEFTGCSERDLYAASPFTNKRLNRILNEFRPIIDRIPYYCEIFNLPFSERYKSENTDLPPALSTYFLATNNYRSGAYSIPHVQLPHFSLTDWYRIKGEFKDAYSSGNVRAADALAKGMLEISSFELSPESSATLITSLACSDRNYKLGLTKYLSKLKSRG